jgi:hypothetical protein
MGGGGSVLSRIFLPYSNWVGICITKRTTVVPQLSDEKLVAAVSLFVDKTYNHELRLTLCAFVEVMYVV